MPLKRTDSLDHKLMCTLYDADFSLREIGALYGVSGQRIQQILAKYDYHARLPGPRPKSKARYSPQIDISSILDILDDWGAVKIYNILDLPYISLYSKRKLSRLFPTRFVEIITLFNSGLSPADISFLTGASKGYVVQALHRARAYGIQTRPGRRGIKVQQSEII